VASGSIEHSPDFSIRRQCRVVRIFKGETTLRKSYYPKCEVQIGGFRTRNLYHTLIEGPCACIFRFLVQPGGKVSPLPVTHESEFFKIGACCLAPAPQQCVLVDRTGSRGARQPLLQFVNPCLIGACQARFAAARIARGLDPVTLFLDQPITIRTRISRFRIKCVELTIESRQGRTRANVLFNYRRRPCTRKTS